MPYQTVIERLGLEEVMTNNEIDPNKISQIEDKDAMIAKLAFNIICRSQKLSSSLSGRKMTDDWKNKVSQAMMGNKNGLKNG